MLIQMISIFVLSFFLNYLLKKIAPKIGAVDKPNERRMNKQPIPNIGGISIYIALIISYFLLHDAYLLKLIYGATVIVIVGVIDDMYEISPKVKFLGQFIAANVAYFSGIEFGYDPKISYFFVILWFLVVINALNFIDGIDGLSSGISLIIILSFGLTNHSFLNIALLLTSAIIGFMFHNFSKNKIMLGDNGAMLLGYVISYFLGIEYFKDSLYYYPIPFIFVFIILYDLVFVVLDRKIRGVSISHAERNHLHHRIMHKGYSPKKTLMIIYGMVIITCCVAYFLADKITKYI